MKRLKKLVIIVMTLFLAIPMMNYVDALEIDGRDYLESIKLQDSDGKKDFTNQEEISFNTLFKVRINFKDISDGMGIEIGKKYLLQSLPEVLKCANTNQMSWDVLIEGSEDILGTTTVENKNIYFTFDKAFQEYDKVEAAYIELNVQLDKEKCTNKEKVEIQLDGLSPTYTITITDNKPQAPTIKKNGTCANGIVTWVVDIQQGGNKYNNNIFLKDTFSSNQDYVEKSFHLYTIQGDNREEVLNPQLVVKDDSHTLQCENILDQFDYQVIYQTQFNAEALIDDNHTTLTNNKQMKAINNAELYDGPTGDKITGVSQTLSEKSGVNWVVKTSDGKLVEDSVDKTKALTKWTITIDTHGNEFKNLILTDIITDGLPVNSSSQLSIDKNSIQINGTSYDWQGSQNNVVTGNKLSWTFNLNEAMKKETLNGVYEFTYYTEITQYLEYLKYNQKEIQNSASLTFDADLGTGVEKSYQALGMNMKSALAKGSIKKDFVKYDSSTHQMTWKITVNEQGIDLSNHNVVGIEDMSLAGHTIINVGDAQVEDQTIVPNVNYSSDYKNATIEFAGADIGSHTLIFQVTTKIDDPNYYENNNTNQEFINKATLVLDGVNYSTVQAKAKPKINVLSKNAKGYNYQTNCIQWEIEVNKDAMSLKDSVIEDQLIDNLSLVQGTVKLIDHTNKEVTLLEKADTQNQSLYYTYENKMLKVYLGDITNQYKLTFETYLDRENGSFYDSDKNESYSFGEYNGDITISNEVRLHKSTSTDTVEKANQKITNKILEKTGTPVVDQQRVDYRVIINQAKHTMQETVLTDILSSGLQLSLPSLHLYEANVNSDGTFTKNEDKEVKNIEYSTTIIESGDQSGATCLTITIPENDGIAYVLEYKAYVKDFTVKDYSNQISGEGITPGGNETVYNVTSKDLGVGSGAVATKSGKAIFKLTDSQNSNRPLSGVSFALKYRGRVIDKQIINAKGEVIFVGLEEGIEYTIEQINIPIGYQGTPILFTFRGPKPGTANIYNQTVTNEKILISIYNKDEESNVIKNSQFTLYQIPKDFSDSLSKENVEALLDDKAIVATHETNVDGKVVFDNQLTDGLYVIKQNQISNEYILSNDMIVIEMKDELVIKMYHLGDQQEIFDNHIINIKKMLSTPLEPSIPLVKDPIPPVKDPIPPINGAVDNAVSTNDSTNILESIVIMIVSISAIFYLRKRKVRKLR